MSNPLDQPCVPITQRRIARKGVRTAGEAWNCSAQTLLNSPRIRQHRENGGPEFLLCAPPWPRTGPPARDDSCGRASGVR